MRISIVNGFFLPVPPISGGATEKSWYHLARQFAGRGHQVTMISRCWRGFANDETTDGIRHIRLPGADHKRKLWQNLLLDFIWSWRVFFALPTADIVVVNAVALPTWLGWLKARAGKIVIMTGRMPKGQYRRYRHIARVLAASSYVLDRVVEENPRLATVSRVVGYPIDWRLLNQNTGVNATGIPEASPNLITLGYVGRIHTEKGLDLLVQAIAILNRKTDLPPWQLLLCGPSDIARGGSGGGYRSKLLHQLSLAIHSSRFHLLDPQFNDRSLASVYRRMQIFCYPSLAEKGETFGVAVAEAMAAGAVPVVSELACFTDFVKSDHNGVVFNHRAPDAAQQLAAVLARLISDHHFRERLGKQARQDAQHYDYAIYAENLLLDFAELTTSPSLTASNSP